MDTPGYTQLKVYVTREMRDAVAATARKRGSPVAP